MSLAFIFLLLLSGCSLERPYPSTPQQYLYPHSEGWRVMHVEYYALNRQELDDSHACNSCHDAFKKAIPLSSSIACSIRCHGVKPKEE